MAEHEDGEDAFGFGSLRVNARDRIRDIKPAVPLETTTDLSKVDAVADIAGVVSREPYDVPPFSQRTRQQRPEPRSALDMRVPVSLGVEAQQVVVIETCSADG